VYRYFADKESLLKAAVAFEGRWVVTPGEHVVRVDTLHAAALELSRHRLPRLVLAGVPPTPVEPGLRLDQQPVVVGAHTDDAARRCPTPFPALAEVVPVSECHFCIHDGSAPSRSTMAATILLARWSSGP
jgi:AcrR family transcriptional regulator